MGFYVDGQIVQPGQTVLSFRGEEWTFLRITREPEPGKGGKVYAQRGAWKQELYPSVFNGEIR